MADEWFEVAIGDGLAALFLLNLKGKPPAEATGAVLDVWLAALWPRVQWDEKRDAQRIMVAFGALAANSKEFPTPALFREALPPRAPVPELAGPGMSEAQRQANRARLAGIMRELSEKLNPEEQRRARFAQSRERERAAQAEVDAVLAQAGVRGDGCCSETGRPCPYYLSKAAESQQRGY